MVGESRGGGGRAGVSTSTAFRRAESRWPKTRSDGGTKTWRLEVAAGEDDGGGGGGCSKTEG